MEIRKGISQMAEYPNREINYVIPSDGKMYYVLNDGILNNGCVIATLDPKRAIDDSILCNSIGVFKEDGTVLIDFDKKDIKKVSDDYLLVVNSTPTTELVINALKNENDAITKRMVKDNSTTIVDKMMIEMGITGGILFSDAYGEANIYKTDIPNNKIGPDCSFIGKNDMNFYFHTNDPMSETIIINLLGQKQENNNFSVLDSTANQVLSDSFNNSNTVQLDVQETPNEEEVIVPNFSANTNDISPQDLKLDISQNILDGFKSIQEHEIPTVEISNSNEEKNENSEDNSGIEQQNDNSEKNDEVLDKVIQVMKKMIEETTKLNDRISELESQLEEKNKIITAEESKKNELNDLLDEAHEILENID